MSVVSDNAETFPADQPRNATPQLFETERRPADSERPSRAGEPLGRVTLVVDSPNGADDQRIDVPFYDLHEMNPTWLSRESLALPPEVVRVLERLGHEVRRDRGLVPIDLEDGRRVVIPVEQFEITPVTGRSFQ
jgi:hypothetical protein